MADIFIDRLPTITNYKVLLGSEREVCDAGKNRREDSRTCRLGRAERRHVGCSNKG